MNEVKQRREGIVDLVNTRDTITFSELKEQFPDVSEMTLRTDLKTLDAQKKIVRIHGGAKSIGTIVGNDDLIGRRSVRNVAEKHKIAEKAVALIDSNTTVFLDSGSTTTELAKRLKDQPNIIYTSSLTCAVEMARLSMPEVYLPGGQMNKNSLSVGGLPGVRELEMINFDIAFIGVTSYMNGTGFTCGSAADAILKQTVIGHTERVVVLMDSSKIGGRDPYTICDLHKVDTIISDDGLPEQFLKECARYGIEVL